MEAVVNGKSVRYDDNYIDALRDIMIFHLPHIQFQQTDHARENLIAQVKQFSEVLILEKEAAATKEAKRKITTIQRKLVIFKEVLGYCKSREVIQNKLYNFILSLEKLGPLHGFGFSNIWGDKIKGDAERQSLRKIG
jgi:hypothetical protein